LRVKPLNPKGKGHLHEAGLKPRNLKVSPKIPKKGNPQKDKK